MKGGPSLAHRQQGSAWQRGPGTALQSPTWPRACALHLRSHPATALAHVCESTCALFWRWFLHFSLAPTSDYGALPRSPRADSRGGVCPPACPSGPSPMESKSTETAWAPFPVTSPLRRAGPTAWLPASLNMAFIACLLYRLFYFIKEGDPQAFEMFLFHQLTVSYRYNTFSLK